MKRLTWLITIIMIASMVLSACAQATQAPVVEVPATEAPMVTEAPVATEAPVVTEAPVEPKSEKILRIGYTSDIATLDPAMMTVMPDWAVASAIYSGLVRFKPGVTAEVQPDLAESWDISPDNLVWTFHLRKGVQWQRGYGEVTAKDVVFTYERVMDPATGSPYRADESLIQKVEAVDDYTVRFTFSSPSAIFLPTVAAFRPGRILCQKAMQELGENYNANAVGSGPYILDHWTIGVEIALVKNPDYWNADAYKLDGITWKIIKEESVALLALQSGDIDWFLPSDPDAMKTLAGVPGISLTFQEGTNHVKMFINTSHPPFDDVRVRQAINYAIDKQVFLTWLGDLGQPALSEIAPFSFGYTADVTQYDFNPEKAKELLAEAGYPDNGINFHLLGTRWGTYAPAVEIVADQLTQAGFLVNLEIMEGGPYYAALTKGDFDGAVSGIGRVEPSQLLYRFHSKNVESGVNTVRFSDPELDKLLDEQLVTLDPTERADQLQQIQKLLRDFATTVPLFINQVAIAKWDYVTGDTVDAMSVIAWDLVDIQK